MNLHHAFGVGLLLTGFLAAQSDTTRVEPAASVRGSTGLTALPDGALAGGRDYEALFGAGGVTFLPVFGSRAERTMPLHWTLRTVRRGGVLVHEAATGVAPAIVADAPAVTYARGAVTERYDVRVGGLEQSFVFAQPLPGDGDVVVRLDITTELAASQANDGTLRFVLPGVGAVTFGKVTGIDANGTRADGSLRLAGDAIELVLPDAFVDAAKFPLVLDPLVGVQFDATGGGFEDSEPDLAYDASNDVYLVTWRRRFSATNSLIRAQRVSGGGALVGGTLFLTPIGSQVQKHARVCNVNARDRFVVAWEEAPFLAGPRDVWATAVDAATGVQSTNVALLATGDDEFDPCVAGEATNADDEALLAWMDPNNINARQIAVPASPGAPSLAGGTAVVASSFLAGNLCLSKSSGSTGRLLLAYTSFGLLSDNEVALQLMTRDAALIGGVVNVTNNTVDEGAPAVDGDGNRFVLAYERYEAGGTRDILARPVHASGAGLTVGVERGIAVVAGVDDIAPDVCCLGATFAVLWQRSFANFFDDVYGTVIAPDCRVCGNTFVLGGLNTTGNHNYESRPRCIGRFAGSTGAAPHGFVVFAEAENTPPFEGDVIGQRFAYVDQVTNLGGGCGGGGTIQAPCMETGNANFAFTLTRATPNVTAFLMLSLTQNGRTCGACTLHADVWTGFAAQAPNTNAAGNTQFVLGIPADTSIVGFAVYAQYAVVGTNCFLGTADLSNGIRATIQ